ncbi:unnamed protein product [Rhizophagus irregularis]|nr:unnamed protein product [Rhizophagus irregularis]
MMRDPAYDEILDTNRELRNELAIEVANNKAQEEKIRALSRELERCYRTISLQDKTITTYEDETTDLKSQIKALRKQLTEIERDLKHKDQTANIQDNRIIELEEKVAQLRGRIWELTNKKISVNNLSPESNMSTIAELANAIDGYLDSATTNRAILKDQVKRATDQIRIKFNNLLRDQRDERRNRQQVETELGVARRDRDIARRERDTIRGERDAALLAYNNEARERRRWQVFYRNKDRRVQELLQEIFAFRLLYQRKDRLLRRCRADRGLLEYNRDMIYNRYEKWKNKTHAERQNILNLQQQILALQNNPPNQVVNMAGLPIPFFDWGDDIPNYLAQLRLYLQHQGVDPADNAAGPPTGRDQALGYLRGTMRGRALEWFDEEITNKQNWELANLLDGTGVANILLVNGQTAVQLGAANLLNEAVGQAGNQIVKLRAAEGPWDEDWRIAGGRPTNLAPNAPNAGAGNTVVVPGIRFGQAVWWFKTRFPTEEEELRDLEYGTMKKGNMSIDEYYRKLSRIGRRANYRPEELRRRFIDGLPMHLREKADDIGEDLPLGELANKLYKIELRRVARQKSDGMYDPLVSQRASQQIYEPSSVATTQQQGLSLADMQKILQDALAKQQAESRVEFEKMKADLQTQMTQQKAQASVQQVAEPIRQPRGPPPSLRTKKDLDDYTLAELFRDIGIMSQEDFDSDFPVKPFQRARPQKPNFSSRIERVEEGINETRDTVNQLSDLFQKQAYIRKCEICNETGHSKSQCPRRIAKSNLTRTYFTPLRPIIPQYTHSDEEQDLNGEGYDEEENRWYDAPVKKNRHH